MSDLSKSGGFEKTGDTVFALALDTYQWGQILGALSEFKMHKNKHFPSLEPLYEVLVRIHTAVQEVAGITVKELPDGRIKLTDEHGTTMVRTKYLWETCPYCKGLLIPWKKSTRYKPGTFPNEESLLYCEMCNHVWGGPRGTM